MRSDLRSLTATEAVANVCLKQINFRSQWDSNHDLSILTINQEDEHCSYWHLNSDRIFCSNALLHSVENRNIKFFN